VVRTLLPVVPDRVDIETVEADLGILSGPAPGFPTVGVIGAGQLARMLVPRAIALGIGLRVLASTAGDAAARVTPAVLGDHQDLDVLRRFGRGVDVLTVEHEHVPGAHLAALDAEGVPVRPSAAALVHAQDKIVMRRRLAELDAPGPAWTVVADPAALLGAGESLGWPLVAKRPRGGYDGRGVAVVHRADVASVLDSSPTPVGAGLADWWARDGALLAEQRVPFLRELAVLLARSPSGQIAVWPVVETVQSGGVCREVVAPAPDLDTDMAAAAALTAARLAGALDVVGVLAVEGFEVAPAPADRVGTPRFLVNELAMRPHNSGHWTIEGSVTDQFEQHLRAVLDLPLGAVRAVAPFTVMVNVLGAGGAGAGRAHGPADPPDPYSGYLHVMARDPEVRVHVYGKEIRPGRKVGHVTVSGDDVPVLLERARHAADHLAGTGTG
jgi:5-(carboxyamino)imidazole ribonucleotide synthase